MRVLLVPLVALALVAPARAARDLGLNIHQSTDVGPQVAGDAGVRWARVDMNWLDVEPQEGAFDWSRLDAVVDAARAKNLEVLAVVGYTPAWASTGDTKGDGSTNDVPQAGRYEAFVTATVSHFQGRISHYELWNEPNLAQFWEGSVQQYTSLVLLPGADAVHAACPSCKVVSPGLASVGTAYADWLDAILTAAQPKLDVINGHIYADFPADNPQAGVTTDSFWNKLDAHRKIVVNGITIYEGPLSFHEVMVKHGATQPFWLTETGREAAITDGAACTKQATYYREVMEAMLPRPWWQTTIFYEGFDEPNSGYTFGVALHDAQAASGYDPKPAFSVLQKAATSPDFGGSGTECSDGLDNDGDGKTDYPADPDCASPSTMWESPMADGGVAPDGGAPADAGLTLDGGGAARDLAMGGGDDGAAMSGDGAGSSGGCAVGGSGGGGLAILFALAFAVALLRRAISRR